MKPSFVVLALFVAVLGGTAAKAGPSDEARAVYRQFAAAQNMRDLETVGALLLGSPNFLWVSDGKSIWGRAAVLKRMALLQEARIWHVEPDIGKAVAVAVGGDTAFLHLPLELTLAFSAAEPETLRFLVSVLCVRTAQGWRIAALFTATQNPT